MKTGYAFQPEELVMLGSVMEHAIDSLPVRTEQSLHVK